MPVTTVLDPAARARILAGVADLMAAGAALITEERMVYFAPVGTWSWLTQTARADPCGCALGAAYVGARLRITGSVDEALEIGMGDQDACYEPIAAALGVSDLDLAIEVEIRDGDSMPLIDAINDAHVSGSMSIARIATTLRALAAS